MNRAPHVIATPRLVLRMWRSDDRDALRMLHQSDEMMRFLGGPMSHEDCDAMFTRLRSHWDDHDFGAWAVTNDDELIGFAGIVVPRFESRFMPCVESLWRLSPAHWGKGFATEAARAALTDGFARFAFDEVLAFVTPKNEKSWRVMERLGMTRSEDDDFDHPLVAEGEPFRRHRVYRITRSVFASRERI